MVAEHVALGLTNEWWFEGNAELPPHQHNCCGLPAARGDE
jgi:hypothetical protein